MKWLLLLLSFAKIASCSAYEDIEHIGCGLDHLDEHEVLEMNLHNFSDSLMMAAPFPQIDIPVAWHVIYPPSKQGYVPLQNMMKNTQQLNDAFSGAEARRTGYGGSKDTNIRFHFHSVDYTENEDWFSRCPLTDRETQFKKALSLNPAKYLNVYTCNNMFAFGLAQLPYGRDPNTRQPFTEDSYMLGVTLWYKVLPGGGHPWYKEGDILTHEVGHHLGLLHPYQGSCYGNESYSDGIADTPRMLGQVKGTCAQNRGLNSCKGGPPDDIRNYMIATTDDCRNHFTPGQVEFIQNVVRKYKPTLLKKLPDDCVTAVDSTDNSPDLKPCRSEVITNRAPPGKSAVRPWCYTTVPNGNEWGYACCPPDTLCRQGRPNMSIKLSHDEL